MSIARPCQTAAGNRGRRARSRPRPDSGRQRLRTLPAPRRARPSRGASGRSGARRGPNPARVRPLAPVAGPPVPGRRGARSVRPATALRWRGAASTAASACGAGFPSWSWRSASCAWPGLVSNWLATAPTLARASMTLPPTARLLVATAAPQERVASQATMEKVACAGAGASSPSASARIRDRAAQRVTWPPSPFRPSRPCCGRGR